MANNVVETPGTESAPDPQTPRRGRPRDPRADQQILQAAAELLLVGGFEHTTVDDVAARAGVGKATVYRRWATKEDLAVAAMSQLYDTQFPVPDTGSLRGDLRVSIAALMGFVNTPEGEAFVRTSIAESIRDSRIASLYRESTLRSEEQAKEMYARAVDRGEIPADAAVDHAMECLQGIIASRVIMRRAMPQEADVDRLVDLTLRTLGWSPR